MLLEHFWYRYNTFDKKFAINEPDVVQIANEGDACYTYKLKYKVINDNTKQWHTGWLKYFEEHKFLPQATAALSTHNQEGYATVPECLTHHFYRIGDGDHTPFEVSSVPAPAQRLAGYTYVSAMLITHESGNVSQRVCSPSFKLIIVTAP